MSDPAALRNDSLFLENKQDSPFQGSEKGLGAHISGQTITLVASSSSQSTQTTLSSPFQFGTL